MARFKFPLRNYEPFLWEKREREERGKDDRRTNENRVDTGAHIEESHNLRALMDDVRKTGEETKTHGPQGDPRPAAVDPIKHEGGNSETGNKITIKILCPRIVIAIQVVHE